MKGKPRGQYRTEPRGDRPSLAYVVDGKTASFLDEARYKSKGAQPEFEALPTEDEYHS